MNHLYRSTDRIQDEPLSCMIDNMELVYVCPDVDIMQVCANLATSPAELLEVSKKLKRLIGELNTCPELVLRDIANLLSQKKPHEGQVCFVWVADCDHMTMATWKNGGWTLNNTRDFFEASEYPYWLALNTEA